MRRKAHPLTLLLTLTAGYGGCCAHEAQAGPPLVCHELQVEEGAELLPWSKGRGFAGTVPGLSPAELASRALQLLDDDQPPFARMETMRRAALALKGEGEAERAAAQRLVDTLLARREAAPGSALAAFDAGWIACTYQQGGGYFRKEGGRPSLRGSDGRARLREALVLSGGDPRFEVAVALAGVGSRGKEPARAFARARAAAAEGRGGEALVANLRELASGHLRDLLVDDRGTDM